MDTNQITEEERQQLAKKKELIIEKNREKFAGFSDMLAQKRKETIKLMQRRHAYYTKLINEAKVKTAQEFYENFKNHFEMYGIKLELSDDKTNCSIYLELGDYDYEQYWIEDGLNGSLATVSPNVAFKDWFTNLEVNIFTGEYL